jgi:hypothetical protein
VNYKRRKRRILLPPVLGLLLFFAFSGAAFAQVAGEISVLAQPEYFSGRLIADAGDFRLFFLSIKDFDNPGKDYRAAGISSPLLTVGPLTTGGLFREIFSPIGYSAASGVFHESSRLSLRTTASRSTRQGLWVSVPGEYISLGAYVDGDNILHSAAALNLGKTKTGPVFSGLLMASRPKSRLGEEDWFASKPLFPGGAVYHAAGRLQILPEEISGGLRLGLSGAFSFGERIVSSGYYNFFAAYTNSLLEVHLLQGSAGAGYVSPSGTSPSYSRVDSGSLKLFPRRPLVPYLKVHRNSYQVYKPQAHTRPKRLSASGGLEYTTRNISAKIEGSGKNENDEALRKNTEKAFFSSFLMREGDFTFACEYAAGWKNGAAASRRNVLRLEYRPRGWEFTARLKSEWKPNLLLSGKLSAAVNRPGLRLGVSAELKKQLAPTEEGILGFRRTPSEYFVFSVFGTYREKFF